MIPRRQPTYDWYDPSIRDTHEVTTRLQSWKIALRPVHNLRTPNKPMDVPTPRVLRSAQKQSPAQPPTRSPPRRVLQFALPTATTVTPLYQQLFPHFIPTDDDTPAPPIRQARRGIHIISLWGPASIAMHALYHVINLSFNNPPGYTIPKNPTTSMNRFQHNTNIEEV